jgi:hypothetical protein
MNSKEKLNWLIEQWCARRELGPLSYLLPVYPSPLIHADDFGQLLEGWRDIKGLCRDKLTAEELNCVIMLINDTEDVLKINK